MQNYIGDGSPRYAGIDELGHRELPEPWRNEIVKVWEKLGHRGFGRPADPSKHDAMAVLLDAVQLHAMAVHLRDHAGVDDPRVRTFVKIAAYVLEYTKSRAFAED